MLYPADKEVKRTIEFSKVIKAQKTEINSRELTLKGQSFTILLK